MDAKLEHAKEIQLKLRNRIIELEKQLQYEVLRANEYQSKFKQAVMENSTRTGDLQLLNKLNQKQRQVNELRKQVMQANRKLNQSSNTQNVDQIIQQNVQMRNVVEQLKNAAIAAIMEKDSQIQQLKRQISEIDFVQHVAELQSINEQLKKQIKQKSFDYEEEIRSLNEKLSLERDGFSQKLDEILREFTHQQNQKEELIEKTQNLQGNLESLQQAVQKYQMRIHELQNLRSAEKISFKKNEHELQRKIDNLAEDLKIFEKSDQNLHLSITSLNKTIQELNIKIKNVSDEKEELDRKLKIKNRKTNPKESSRSIYESFEGFSKKADVYTSFVKKQNYDIAKQSFVAVPEKLSDIKQLQVEQIENFSEYIQEVAPSFSKNRKNSDSTEDFIVYNSSLAVEPQQNSQLKAKTEKILQLQLKIQSLLNEIENYNKIIDNTTKDLQKERSDKMKLKDNYTKSESSFKVERESLKIHIYKLENALLVQKLQNAEKLQSNKEIRQYEKKVYEDEIKRLKGQIESSSKKKKGFFG